jgi:hypothetical protein
MLYQKDGQVLSSYEVRKLHPNVSFAEGTYAELGYTPYLPPAPDVTPEQIKAGLTGAVQRHLDMQAIQMGYDNIFTACTYAEEPAVPKFQQDGRALRAWRSLVWAHCQSVMAAVASGSRTPPSPEELIAELPTL